jgi:hypothetical protein
MKAKVINCMKTLKILSAIIFLAISFQLKGEYHSKVFVGLNGGFSYANFIGKDADAYDPEFKTGLTFGGFLDIGINQHFSLKLETNYIEKGSEGFEEFIEFYIPETYWLHGLYIKEKVNYSFHFKHFEVPVLLNYHPKKIYNISPRIFCGLSMALNFEAQLDVKDGGISEAAEIVEAKRDISEFVEDTDFNAVFGIGFDYKIRKFKTFLDFRYSMGLRDIYKQNEYDYKHSVFTITVGIGYGLNPTKKNRKCN